MGSGSVSNRSGSATLNLRIESPITDTPPFQTECSAVRLQLHTHFNIMGNQTKPILQCMCQIIPLSAPYLFNLCQIIPLSAPYFVQLVPDYALISTIFCSTCARYIPLSALYFVQLWPDTVYTGRLVDFYPFGDGVSHAFSVQPQHTVFKILSLTWNQYILGREKKMPVISLLLHSAYTIYVHVCEIICRSDHLK